MWVGGPASSRPWKSLWPTFPRTPSCKMVEVESLNNFCTIMVAEQRIQRRAFFVALFLNTKRENWKRKTKKYTFPCLRAGRKLTSDHFYGRCPFASLNSFVTVFSSMAELWIRRSRPPSAGSTFAGGRWGLRSRGRRPRTWNVGGPKKMIFRWFESTFLKKETTFWFQAQS